MHEYHAKHGKLPPAALRDREGKLLLSWRVLILPYLGHEELYREFNLGESWDSPHNVRLLAKMPRVFAPIDRNPPQEPHTTLFQVFVGKGTPFEDNRDWRFKDIPRMSNTILIAEAARPVLWTKPEDLPYDENRSVPDLGAIFPGQFHVVFADGTCIPGRKDVAEIDLRSAILRSGNGVWPQGNEHAEIQ
jgi:hypothetical protein